jgi:uncharacterized protein YqcC (DUF446 family)
MANSKSDKTRGELGELLDRIEAQMRAIGFWTDNPPDLIAQYDRGELRSYLDAPTFELWLQCVFIPRARAAIRDNAFPSGSQVGGIAMRQYDYHSYVPEAQELLRLLHEFDRVFEQR